MSTNLYLDPVTHDLVLTGHNLQLTASDSENLSQKIESRLSMFAGEWFLDIDIGVPYYERIFKKNPDYSDVNSLLLSVVATTPGVNEVLKFEVSFETSTRIYSVFFTVNTDFGTISNEVII